MGELLAIEQRFGRVRGERNAPRTLDLDLLWVEGRHERVSAPGEPDVEARTRASTNEHLRWCPSSKWLPAPPIPAPESSTPRSWPNSARRGSHDFTRPALNATSRAA